MMLLMMMVITMAKLRTVCTLEGGDEQVEIKTRLTETDEKETRKKFLKNGELIKKR